MKRGGVYAPCFLKHIVVGSQLEIVNMKIDVLRLKSLANSGQI